MKVRRFRHILYPVFVLMWVSSLSWGATGHRIVGALAERHLTDFVQLEIRRVLSGYTLQDISNWADEIKSDGSHFSRLLSHWHYIDLQDESQLDVAIQHAHTKPENLQEALDFVIGRMREKSYDSEFTEAVLLRLLVHLVADAHQPLHVGSGGDHGGNNCYVRWFSGKWPLRLHSVWDSKLIDAFKLSYSEYVVYLDHVDQEKILAWQQASVTDWLRESYRLHAQIYPAESGLERTDYCVKRRADLPLNKMPKLGYDYQSRVRPILHQRLLQAGIRLAGVLNDLYRSQVDMPTTQFDFTNTRSIDNVRA